MSNDCQNCKRATAVSILAPTKSWLLAITWRIRDGEGTSVWLLHSRKDADEHILDWCKRYWDVDGPGGKGSHSANECECPEKISELNNQEIRTFYFRHINNCREHYEEFEIKEAPFNQEVGVYAS